MSLPFPCYHCPHGPFRQRGCLRGPRIWPQVHWRESRWNSGGTRDWESFLVSVNQKHPGVWGGHGGLCLPAKLQPRHPPARGGPGHGRSAVLRTLRHVRFPQRQPAARPAASLPSGGPNCHSRRGRLCREKSWARNQGGHQRETRQQICSGSPVQVNAAGKAVNHLCLWSPVKLNPVTFDASILSSSFLSHIQHPWKNAFFFLFFYLAFCSFRMFLWISRSSCFLCVTASPEKGNMYRITGSCTVFSRICTKMWQLRRFYFFLPFRRTRSSRGHMRWCLIKLTKRQD